MSSNLILIVNSNILAIFKAKNSIRFPSDQSRGVEELHISVPLNKLLIPGLDGPEFFFLL